MICRGVEKLSRVGAHRDSKGRLPFGLLSPPAHSTRGVLQPREVVSQAPPLGPRDRRPAPRAGRAPGKQHKAASPGSALMSTVPRGLGSSLQGPPALGPALGEQGSSTGAALPLHAPPLQPAAWACRTLTTHLPLHFCPACKFLFNTHQEKGSKCQNNLGFKLFGLNILKGTHPPVQGAKGCFRGS